MGSEQVARLFLCARVDKIEMYPDRFRCRHTQIRFSLTTRKSIATMACCSRQHATESPINKRLTLTYLGQRVVVELSLVNDLDSHLLAGRDVLGELDFGKVPLADGLYQPVLSNMGLVSSSTTRRDATRGSHVPRRAVLDGGWRRDMGKVVLNRYEHTCNSVWLRLTTLPHRSPRHAVGLKVSRYDFSIKKCNFYY